MRQSLAELEVARTLLWQQFLTLGETTGGSIVMSWSFLSSSIVMP